MSGILWVNGFFVCQIIVVSKKNEIFKFYGFKLSIDDVSQKSIKKASLAAAPNAVGNQK